MRHKKFKTTITVFVLLGCILFASYIHMTNGVFDISVKDIFKTILGIEENEQFKLVIFEFRLPRIIIAAVVGVGLALAGVVLQGMTRNPLADPGILGINAGAGAAIVLFMFFFQVQVTQADIQDWLAILLMPIFGFVGGGLAAFIIFSFAYKQKRLDMQRLILTGIAINSGFSALSMYFSLKMNASDFEAAAVWMNGSIYNADWLFVWTILPWVVILSIYLFWKAHLLDYFQLGEENMVSLGIETEVEKRKLMMASVGLVSACVSVSGSIGFIGLIAPHIAKQLVGNHHRSVIVISALMGAFLLIFADFIGKTVFAPSELSVGIVVSIIGIPYFLYLLVKTKS
ncbi:FecCD family ABC transporter permease [Rummeliibacillus suwonensis]|uniref:FecCD family ABC transporter permease n=1 Tax=Rummeliibacillus suwonensis TaxID=1306154 RepID=UPI0011B81729|nr:iron ABC transporter permease [Rummeliibacillus suwonensis]